MNLQLRNTHMDHFPDTDLVLVRKDGGGHSIGWFWSERDAKKIINLVNAIYSDMVCDTCQGTGKWIPECHACLSGYGNCTCKSDRAIEEECPQCKGTGNVLYEFGSIKKALDDLEKFVED